ncbi:MAG: peptidoglycan editing factor PgeF [Pseudomonadota bacterium]
MIPPHLKVTHLSEIPWLSHGFFGRRGGVSKGEFNSLNIGLQKGDSLENVCQNRQRMADALMMGNAPIVFACQKHTNSVLVIDAPFKGDIPIADALVTKRKNLIIGVQTADCVPVLFIDPITKIIAAAHAGWKGLASGILQNTITVMEELGATRANIRAAIGPCIWSASYEVGSDVREAFPLFNDLFTPCKAFVNENKVNARTTFCFDLPMAAYRTLQNNGISSISPSPKDTYTHEHDFFSYRRSTHAGDSRFGGQASLIGMHNR